MTRTVRDLDRLTQCLLQDIGRDFRQWNARRVGANWRMNCPWRDGSDSDSITIHAETGAWTDHRDGPSARNRLTVFYARAFFNGDERACILAKAEQYHLEIVEVNHRELPRNREPLRVIERPRPPEVDTGTEAYGPRVLDWHGPVADLEPLNGEVGRWTYHSRDGCPILLVIRRDPKSFSQWTPARRRAWRDQTGAPQWHPRGLPRDVALPLLDQHLFGDRPDAPILVTEGEKARDAVVRLYGDHPFIATCWPGGAGAASRVDVESLRGRDVVLWPDNDATGFEAMLNLRARLTNVASRVRMINVTGYGDGDDAADLHEVINAENGLVAWIESRAAEPEPEEPAADEAFEYTLTLTVKGIPYGSEQNAAFFLSRMPEFDGLRFDMFNRRPMLDGEPFDDHHVLLAARSIQQQAGSMKLGHIQGGAMMIANDRQHDSLQDYFATLQWDGTPRISGALTEGWGVEPTSANLVKSANMLKAIAARATRPGCKADQMFVLEGPQGVLKSSSLKALCANPRWFTDDLAEFGSKDFARGLAGKLIVEVAELSAMSRSAVEHVKATMTACHDLYVDKYERFGRERPRRCVFFGTTNAQDDGYLQDTTGNRRFIPIRVGVVNLEAIRQNRDQWFAEALHRINAGETWWEFEAGIEDEQASRMESDVWETDIAQWLSAPRNEHVLLSGTGEQFVAVRAIVSDCLRLEHHHQTQMTKNRVHRTMIRLGWKAARRYVDGVQIRGFVRQPSCEQDSSSNQQQ